MIGLILMLLPIAGRAEVISIRTGQVNGVPGPCRGLDDTFHFYAPNPNCGDPITLCEFRPFDFDQACSGPKAEVVAYYPGHWLPGLTGDPDARWIDTDTIGDCYGTPLSVLYCAEFQVPGGCIVADSIRIRWAVDDELGDWSPTYPGANPNGVYLNGETLGPAFSGGESGVESTAVLTHVPVNAGTNHLEVYQRDTGCLAAGLILSCSVYTSCGPVPVQETSWGAVRSTFR
jgi:hypothetical protein